MRRRFILLPFLAALAACDSPQSAESRLPAGSSPESGEPRFPVGPLPDYAWPARSPDFAHGFCFTLVHNIRPTMLIKRLGGEELQRVEWHRIVGPGDGELGVSSRFFIGIARVGEWSIIVEDNGSLGITRKIVEPLSQGGEVLAYRGGGDEPGRLMVFRDGDLALDLDTSAPERLGGGQPAEFRSELLAAGLLGGTNVTDPTGPALLFMATRTGVGLTYELLTERTYLLVTVPQV